MDLKQLEKKIQYVFSDPGLLRLAMRHRSFSADNNERLEFLGDTVLNSLIGIKLFKRHPEFSEGQLSMMRASLVNGETLARVARGLNLGGYLSLGKGEEKAGGRNKTSVLEDALEALIGAVFLDSGWAASEALIDQLFASLVEGARSEESRNYKSELQEMMQAKNQSLPSYKLNKTQGEEHCQIFFVSCRVNGMAEVTEGEGSSRKKAEQVAAKNMLTLIENAYDKN